ncbi:exonuclease SbcCD subunit D [Phocaeicola sp.]
MKILHTADWHLGQTFYEYDRYAEHLHFMDWLRKQIKDEQIDVLLIAGDVFDGPNPSAESQRLYYSFLRKTMSDCPQLQIIIIAGNHDSAARLEAPNPLLEEMNISVRGVIKRDAEGNIDLRHLIVPIYNKVEDASPETMPTIAAYCLAVPYLRQGDYPPAENYAQGVQTLYQQLFEQVKEEGKPIIAMGHLQATGSEISENDRSERTIIGGVEGISPDTFDSQIIYTALGHLHRAQRISGRENVRYSGAPIPMSFAEKNNKNGVTLIEYNEGSTSVKRIEAAPYACLLSIPDRAAPLEEVLAAIDGLPDGEATDRSPYLEIKMQMTEPDTSYKYKIETALQGKSVRLARIVAVMPLKKETGIRVVSYEELQGIKPVDVALDYYKRKYDEKEMPEAMKQILLAVVKEVEQ